MNYDELFTFENLYLAHLDARRSKRSKKDVIRFELNLSENLWGLFDSLYNRDYSPNGYNCFKIYEPKEREIHALEYKDRVVQHCLCDNYLYPLLVSKFIYDNGACQKGKGTDFSQNRLEKFLRSYYTKYGYEGYILKIDVKHFFPSINHYVLKQKIRKVVEDNDIYLLLCTIIDSFNYGNNCGLPMGNQTSQLFALYYLDELDRIIKEKFRFKYYVRYMDDMIIIHNDKKYLKDCLLYLRVIAEVNLRVKFNNKTQIISIKNGVDFLGFHIYLTPTGKVIKKLRQSSKKRLKKRLKLLRYEYSIGEKTMVDINNSLAGFNGHLKRGNTYRLKQKIMKEFVLVKRK